MKIKLTVRRLVRASIQDIDFDHYGQFTRFLQMNHIGPVVTSENIPATLDTKGSLVGAFRRYDLAKVLRWMRKRAKTKSEIST